MTSLFHNISCVVVPVFLSSPYISLNEFRMYFLLIFFQQLFFVMFMEGLNISTNCFECWWHTQASITFRLKAERRSIKSFSFIFSISLIRLVVGIVDAMLIIFLLLFPMIISFMLLFPFFLFPMIISIMLWFSFFFLSHILNYQWWKLCYYQRSSYFYE